MKIINKLLSLTDTSFLSLLHLFVFLAILLIQTPASALEFESVAMRNMTSYQKFEGLSQNAVVLKLRETRVKYLDRFEFASGELTNGDTHSVFIVLLTIISNSL